MDTSTTWRLNGRYSLKHQSNSLFSPRVLNRWVHQSGQYNFTMSPWEPEKLQLLRPAERDGGSTFAKPNFLTCVSNKWHSIDYEQTHPHIRLSKILSKIPSSKNFVRCNDSNRVKLFWFIQVFELKSWRQASVIKTLLDFNLNSRADDK